MKASVCENTLNSIRHVVKINVFAKFCNSVILDKTNEGRLTADVQF